MSASIWLEFAILCGIGLLGTICVMPYTLELSHDALTKTLERIHKPLWLLVLLQGAQGFVLMVVTTALGLFLAHHIGLGAPLLENLLAGNAPIAQAQALIMPAILLGITSSGLLLLLEITVFWPRLPQVMRTAFPIPALWKRFLACFYGGINEELLCRLFLLSLLAWLISLVWHMPDGKPTTGTLWLATILAAIIFGLGHLPATASLVKLTPLLIGRAILLNGIVGIAVGYLFWQYGLEAAMLAHFTADIVLHIIGDSIAKQIRAREAQAQE